MPIDLDTDCVRNYKIIIPRQQSRKCVLHTHQTYATKRDKLKGNKVYFSTYRTEILLRIIHAKVDSGS